MTLTGLFIAVLILAVVAAVVFMAFKLTNVVAENSQNLKQLAKEQEDTTRRHEEEYERKLQEAKEASHASAMRGEAYLALQDIRKRPDVVARRSIWMNAPTQVSVDETRLIGTGPDGQPHTYFHGVFDREHGKVQLTFDWGGAKFLGDQVRIRKHLGLIADRAKRGANGEVIADENSLRFTKHVAVTAMEHACFFVEIAVQPHPEEKRLALAHWNLVTGHTEKVRKEEIEYACQTNIIDFYFDVQSEFTDGVPTDMSSIAAQVVAIEREAAQARERIDDDDSMDDETKGLAREAIHTMKEGRLKQLFGK